MTKTPDYIQELINLTGFTYDRTTNSVLYKNSLGATKEHIQYALYEVLNKNVSLSTCADLLILLRTVLAETGSVEKISLEDKGVFTRFNENGQYDEPTVEYVHSLPSYDVILNYLRQILVGCVEKEILVFIGAGDCGKSTVLEKIFRKALTVEIGQQRQTFVVDSMGGRFASAGSHLAHLTVIDDTTDTIGGKALQTFLKTITNTTRVVEYKGITPFSVNNSMGCIINLNGPFFIKQQHLKACMNRFVIIDFTKVFEKSRDFERKELDRSTLINMALNQTTGQTPTNSEYYKSVGTRYCDYYRGMDDHRVPSEVWVLKGGKYTIEIGDGQ